MIITYYSQVLITAKQWTSKFQVPIKNNIVTTADEDISHKFNNTTLL